MRSTLRVYAVGLLLAACGGDDAVAVDAAIEPDATPPAIVGVWREIPVNPEPEEERAVVSVGADHSFVTDDRGTRTDQVWAIEPDGRLKLSGDGSTTISDFYADEDWFVREATLPVGAVDGVVGTWTGSLNAQSITIELGADLSATISYGVGTGFVGTYTFDGSTILLDGTLGGNPTGLYDQAIPDVVLGTPMYERLPD